MSTEFKNYYELLEVAYDATPQEIHLAYNSAKSAYSPDNIAIYSIMTQQDCNEMIEHIEEAYSILSDLSKRKQYDDARGIVNQFTSNKINNPVPRNLQTPPTISPTKVDTNIQSSVNNSSLISTPTTNQPLDKMIAGQKYNLSYQRNEEFEQEIEKVQEFSGDFLKKIREYKCVSIQRLAEMTKISKTYLHNIEEENFVNLPALVYVRGFVYQYAKCLKLNPEQVAHSFIARAKNITLTAKNV